MLSFRDIPVKQKLMMATMVTTAVALLLAGIGIVLADSLLFRGYLQRDLSGLAHIIADNSTAALAFNDQRSAAETLAALRVRTHLVAACIYRRDGTMLADYRRTGAQSGCPAPGAPDGIRFTSAALTVSYPILLSGHRIGTLVLLYDLGEIQERMKLYGLTVLGVLLASILIAFVLSSRLRTIIAAPISQLARAATSVARTKDYSIRARKNSGDELGVLVDAFNEMLAGIQSRDDNLRNALLDRQEALKEAQNARESLETTVASIGDAVIATDIEGRIVLANRVAQSLMKLLESEMIGKHLDEVFRIFNEFTGAKVESPVTKVLREGAIVGMANHTVLIARDGTEIPIDDSGAPIRGASGEIQGTVLVFRDVTAKRRADETGRLLASIVESSDDAIIGHGLGGVIIAWNRGAERIFGYSAEEMIGKPASALTAPGHVDEIPEILERIARGERVDQFQAPRRTKSGTVIDVSITISPMYDALGRIVGASKIARDVTGQVRAAERLAQMNADLQRANENLARSNDDLERFAFVASHDLQEPLRMITVYSQLLIRTHSGEFDDQAAMCVDNIVGGTKRMRELLSDLLAYAEIGGTPEEPAQTVDLNVVIEKVTQNLKVAIEDSGAVITAGRLPSLSAYEGHFIPLFQNLIGNAIKYRGEQQPRIHVSAQMSDGELRFSVADNGIGIPPQHHQKIFTPFKRLHGKATPGTGIGLAICQRVVERYGGRIWVESDAGKGATFIFTVPDIAIHAVEEN